MPIFIAVSLLLVFGVLFGVSLRRSSEVFVLRVRGGRRPGVKLVRGRVPPRLMQDLRDILEAGEGQGTLRVLHKRGAPSVDARGNFSPATLQRARNIVGVFPRSQLLAGRTPRSR